MLCVEDPVFAMAESYFLDGGGRLVDVDERSLVKTSERRSVAFQLLSIPDVGRCQIG